MKLLYLDCSMGAAGDMLTAALLELFEAPDKIIEELNQLGIPGVRFCAESSVKCGIAGTHMKVLVSGTEEAASLQEHHHGHSGISDISHLLSHLTLPMALKDQVLAVYGQIAEAESLVHGVPVEQIHFHEVGTLDALADITAVCYLLHRLGADRIMASPVHVGSGQVKCAHGILPVPAPATAQLLKGVPIYGGEIQGELCTPTGAALLKHFVSEFGAMPPMSLTTIGYGMGQKDFPAANCVRALLGHSSDLQDCIAELSCNLDDMTPEEMSFAMEQLLQVGALDVFTTSIGMKKNRPATQLTVLCRPEDRHTLVKAMFRHTTTLGIRQKLCTRYTLRRTTETLQSPYGEIRRKLAEGYGVSRCKLEYEDLSRIAKEQNTDLFTLKRDLE